MIITAYSDGGSKNNQIPEKRHGYGSFLVKKDGVVLTHQTLMYGSGVTNNEAEWLTLLAVLDYCVKEFLPCPQIHMDSELLINQVQGIYKTNQHIRHMEKAKKIVALIDATLIKVPREIIVEVLGH